MQSKQLQPELVPKKTKNINLYETTKYSQP